MEPDARLERLKVVTGKIHGRRIADPVIEGPSRPVVETPPLPERFAGQDPATLSTEKMVNSFIFSCPPPVEPRSWQGASQSPRVVTRPASGRATHRHKSPPAPHLDDHSMEEHHHYAMNTRDLDGRISSCVVGTYSNPELSERRRRQQLYQTTPGVVGGTTAAYNMSKSAKDFRARRPFRPGIIPSTVQTNSRPLSARTLQDHCHTAGQLPMGCSSSRPTSGRPPTAKMTGAGRGAMAASSVTKEASPKKDEAKSSATARQMTLKEIRRATGVMIGGYSSGSGVSPFFAACS